MVLERRAWTGRYGESQVVAELEQQGHRILQRNWRWRRAEVDVISTDGTVLVFHEVKCRSGRDTLSLDPMMWWPHVAQQRRLVHSPHRQARAIRTECEAVAHSWQFQRVLQLKL